MQIAHLLLQAQAKHDIKNKDGDAANTLAVKLAEDGCCKLLVEFGADVSVEYEPKLAAAHRQSVFKKKPEEVKTPKYDTNGFLIDPSKKLPARPKLQEYVFICVFVTCIGHWKKSIP